MPRLLSTLTVLASLAACGHRDAAPPAPAPAAAVAVTPLARTSQDDLAREVADAERLGNWSELPKRWQGQHVHWTVTRHRALCRTADDCNVAAFPIQRPAKQGWMPGLAFAPGEFAALTRACGDRDACEVTIEATLGELEASPEMPTRVQLTGVRLAPTTKLARK